MDKKKIIGDIENIVGEVKKIKGVLAVYVFGSYVKDKMSDLSDVDICIVGEVALKNKTNILLGKFPEMFDVSFFDELPIWIKMRVFRDGKCIFVKDKNALNLIKLLTLKEYLDFKPFIDDVIKREVVV